MEPVNLDNTKSLERIAAALELISIQLTLANALRMVLVEPGTLDGDLEDAIRTTAAGCANALVKSREKKEGADE